MPSPSYTQQKALKRTIETEKFEFVNLLFSRFSLTGDRATIRLTVESRTKVGLGQADAVRRVFYNFAFIDRLGTWKIWKQSNAQSELATAINQAETQTEVETLLRTEEELVNIYLIEELSKQGAAVFFADPNRARRSFQRAYEIARLVDSRSPSSASKNAIGSTLHNLANTERAQGNYGKVLEYEDRAMALATTPTLKTDVLLNIGITHGVQNNYNLSFEFLIRALASANAIQTKAERNGRIGLIYDSLGLTVVGSAKLSLS